MMHLIANKKNIFPEKLYALDILRGLAALIVLFWHWQHFFYENYTPTNFNKEQQPFYHIFKLFYDHGLYAVELFFCISGFIFSWLYKEKIQTRSITPSYFALLRFSRLYPLFIMSLLITAVLQLIYKSNNGYFFVYKYNDFYHFILNIFMMNSWGFESGFSFNGPAWSISTEILMYILFFLVCSLKKSGLIALVILISSPLILKLNYAISVGFYTFTLGCCTYHIYQKYLLKFQARVTTLVTLTLLAPCAYLASLSKLNIFILSLLLFPLIIILFASLSMIFNHKFKRIKILGEISYSMYLLHFPIQIMIALVAKKFDIPNLFYKPASFIFFLVLVTLTSTISFLYFEKPIQLKIRNKFKSLDKKS